VKRSSRIFVAGMTLAMLVGCSGASDKPANELPPSPTAPATGAGTGGYEVTAVSDGGSITGTISLSGPVQKLPQRRIAKDPQVCGTAPRDSQKLLVGRGGGLKNAVVIVEGVKRGKAMPAAAQNAEIDQSKCEYSPHVQVMAVNSEIALKNDDPILHNIQFFEGENSLFNIAQPVQGQVNKRKIEKTGALYVECAVHGWMQANVVVVDNPYYAVTDDNGKFSIADLPPGTYHVKVFHEYLGEMTSDVTVASKAAATLDMDLKDLLAKKAAPAITSAPAAPGTPGAAAGDSSAGAANQVTVQMREVTGAAVEAGTFRFEPANLTIKVGTTVKWINTSGEDGPRHTSTDDKEWETPQSEAILPAGAMKWRTPFLRNGESATHTFTVPGKYQYFCETHGQYGMIGTITVTP
jgi:plastocyanin